MTTKVEVMKIHGRCRFGFFDRVDGRLFPDEFYEEVEFPDEVLELYKDELRRDGYKEEELEEWMYERLIEDLMTYTIYYKPEVFDPQVALKCNLLPFEYRGVKLLALGACGMDLSPRLDAYQLLVSGTIDVRSTLFYDEVYFKYVVGEQVYREVKKKLEEIQDD